MRKKNNILIIAGLLVIAAVIVLLLRYWKLSGEHQRLMSENSAKIYQYHCVYITENNEDPFWNSIYEGAKEEGIAKDIYVENYGETLSLNYTLEEKLEMAIASGVDAIIIEGIKTNAMTRLIDTAADKGIAVVTVYKDIVGSKRQSFIGINNFQMGYNICAEAYQYLDDNDGEIMIVYDESSQESQDNTLLGTGMKKYLEEMNSEATLNTQLITSNETYDTQEKIRSLLRNKSTRPAIMVCTNMVQTHCAYQSVVDLNCVGEVKIIGFYTSQTIREAIEKDIIQATLVVDTVQMGREAINNIKEYFAYGYSSDYVSVNMKIVNKENVEVIAETEPEG